MDLLTNSGRMEVYDVMTISVGRGDLCEHVGNETVWGQNFEWAVNKLWLIWLTISVVFMYFIIVMISQKQIQELSMNVFIWKV